MSISPLELFEKVKRLWTPGQAIVTLPSGLIELDNYSIRAIHLIQDCLNTPGFVLEHACDRNFFWSVVACDFKRLDALNWKPEAKRSKKYHNFLKQLEAFDQERFYQLVTLYPKVVHNFHDEDYQWVSIVK